MLKRIISVVTLLAANVLYAQLDPSVTSWIINTTSATGYGGLPSNVQEVQYSANNVYVSCSCIPGYDIGPWTGNPNTPSNQNFVFKITRNPVQNTGTLVNTALGHIGVWKNGVSIFNAKDAASYNNQDVWHQDAVVVEGGSFDNCLGHPAPNGEYHLHLNPTCLYDDGDNTQHSPLVGFAFDGFPIYGAYAYANTDGTGGIKRMESSYQVRSITTRTILPDGTAASSAGPAVSSTYPLGYYIEDYEYVQGSGDLDEHNGRFCITPEYPGGIYAYFVTIDSNKNAVYPYIIGPQYYGTVQTGNTGMGSGHNTVTETVSTYTTTGIHENNENSAISLFPNPATDVLNVFAEDRSMANVDICIMDIYGKKIMEQHLSLLNRYPVDVSSLSMGVYVLSLHAESHSSVFRFVVQ